MLSTSRPLERSRAVPRKIEMPPMRFDRPRTRLISASTEKSSRCTRTNISSLFGTELLMHTLLHETTLATRMFKLAVQQGRSKRRDEAYFVRYVEPLSDARTQLAARFNILADFPLHTAASRLLHRLPESSDLRARFLD